AGAVDVGETRHDGRLVLQLQPRAVGSRQQPERQPADPAAELPGSAYAYGLHALRDGAAGVALELVAAALAQVARHGQEPAREPLLRGESVPQFGSGSVVGTARGQHRGLRALART